MRVVGQTSNGKLVLAGIYQFYETYGLPLDLIAEELKTRGFVIGWDHFYHEASHAGVSHRKIITRIFECVETLRRRQ